MFRYFQSKKITEKSKILACWRKHCFYLKSKASCQCCPASAPAHQERKLKRQNLPKNKTKQNTTSNCRAPPSKSHIAMGLSCSEPDKSQSPFDNYETRYNQPPADPYEIPPELVERHHASFQRFSAEKYLETLSRLQLTMLIDHSGSMRTPDQDGTGRPTLRNWRMYSFH